MSRKILTIEPIPDPGGPRLITLSVFLIFLGSLEFLTIGFSLAGLVVSNSLALLIIFFSAIGASAYYRWFRRSATAPGNGITGVSRLSPSVKVLALPAVSIYGSLWLLAYALPDFSYDGLWYHIPAMHFWGLAGRVHWITPDFSTAWDPLIDNCLNGFPKGVELVTFVLVRATGLSRLANAVNLPFLPLGALGVASLSRVFGAKRNFAILAGVLFILIPVNIGQAITSYVDTATAAVYIAAFALLAETLVRVRKGELFWRGLPALGAAAGLAMGAKTPGIIFPPLCALVLAAAFLPAGVRRGFRTEKLFLRAGGFISVFLAIAVLVGGYWPIRNYIHTGNPVNPVGVEVAGRTIFPDHSWPGQFHEPYREGTEDWSQFRRVLGSWVYNFRDWWPRSTYGALEGGLGFLWIFGALPALLALLAGIFLVPRRSRERKPVVRQPTILLILLGFTILLFNLMPPHHNHLARYTIWLYGVGLPAFALAGGVAWHARRRLRRVLGRIWVVGVVVLFIAEGAAVWLHGLEMTSRYWDDWQAPPPLVHRLRRSLARPYPSGYPSGSLMDSLLTGRPAAALGPLRDRRVLLLGRLAEGGAFGRREIYFLDPDSGKNAAGWQNYLEERDLRFAAWDEGIEVPPDLAGLSLLDEYAPGGYYILGFNHRLTSADNLSAGKTGGGGETEQ